MGGAASGPGKTEMVLGRTGPGFALDRAIDEVLKPWKDHDEPVVVLFSGGVDSGLLAWELRGSPRLRLFTAGAPHSADLPTAHEAARNLHLPWTGREVGPSEVIRIAMEQEPELAGLPAVDRSVQIALAVAIAHAPRGPLLCGQGIDELFGGYAHFRGLPTSDAVRRAESDLHKLLVQDWPRTVRIAARLGRTVMAPYLDPRFRDAALAIPPDERLAGDPPKAWFRSWARQRGLPETLALRPKRAFQYSSGFDRILRQSA